MFEAAVGKLVKSVCGDGSVLPVPNLDAADDCRPMHVVVKKRRRWCFQKATYSPQPFCLHDLLVNTESLDVNVKSRSYVTYNQTSKFSVSGDVGASLKEVVDLKFSASDTISVEALFGEVLKLEVDEKCLLNSLERRLLNFNHSLVQEIMQNPRKVLCVVVGTALNKSDSQLHMHAVKDGKEMLNLMKPVKKVVEADIDSAVSDDQDASFKIPQNTPLAYNVYELLVKPGGQLSVILQKDCNGGFQDFDSIDGFSHNAVDGLVNDGQVTDADTVDGGKEDLAGLFAGILQLDTHQRAELRTSILAICQFSQDIAALLAIMESGCEGRETGTVPASDLQELIKELVSPSTTWQGMLQMLGFQFKDDGSMGFPAEQTDLLSAIYCLFEALNQLDKDKVKGIIQINQQMAPSIALMVKKALDGGSLTLTDAERNADNEEISTTIDFLKIFGFQQTGNTLAPPGEKHELEAAYCALFGLWLTPQDIQQK